MIVAAEKALGRRLVQVGFMRRFDPAYVAMQALLRGGSARRRADAALPAPQRDHAVVLRSRMPISNAAAHEFDIARWLLGQEFTRSRVFRPARRDRAGVLRPMFMVLETTAASSSTSRSS